MTQLESFAFDMRFLLGLLVFLALLLIVAIAVWTGLKVWVFRVRSSRAQREEHERKHGPDGRTLPPVGEGICERCQGVFQEVFHLPSGRRLCRSCYEISDASGDPPGR